MLKFAGALSSDDTAPRVPSGLTSAAAEGAAEQEGKHLAPAWGTATISLSGFAKGQAVRARSESVEWRNKRSNVIKRSENSREEVDSTRSVR